MPTKPRVLLISLPDARPSAIDQALAGESCEILDGEPAPADGESPPVDLQLVDASPATLRSAARLLLRSTPEGVAERKRSEDALRIAHEKLRTTLDSITDGLVVLDREWRVSYFSSTGARMIGVRPENLVGRPASELFPGAGGKFVESFHQAAASGQPVHFEEYYPPLSLWLECHYYPSAEGLSVYVPGRPRPGARDPEGARRSSRRLGDGPECRAGERSGVHGHAAPASGGCRGGEGRAAASRVARRAAHPGHRGQRGRRRQPQDGARAAGPRGRGRRVGTRGHRARSRPPVAKPVDPEDLVGI